MAPAPTPAATVRGPPDACGPAGAPPVDAWFSASVAFDAALAPWTGRAAIAQRQDARLAALLETAARRSPMYRRLLRGRDPATLPLRHLPIVHKRPLMARFGEWVTDPALRLDALRRFMADARRIGEPFLGRYTVWQSSGSSGEPGVFVQDAASMAVYDALESLRRPSPGPAATWLDPWGWHQRVAFVGAIDGHFASVVSIERLRRINPALGARLDVLSLLQPTGELVARLNRIAPTVLATYPSAAALLAVQATTGALRIEPQQVWTGGETLSVAMRRSVEHAFGCPVVDSYGTSEFLSLACECRQGGLHLNSDWAILEAVDAHGRPAASDVAGTTTLLTNLANHVQPVIRYDLGDRVRLHAQPCGCGSALPRIDVEGRCDDMLTVPGSAGRPVCLPPLALSTVLEDEGGLFDFQLVQVGPARLALSTSLPGAAGRAAVCRARQALGAYLHRQGAADVRIDARCGRPARASRSGKLRRIVAWPAAAADHAVARAGRPGPPDHP